MTFKEKISLVKLLPGHYDLDSTAKKLSGLFKKYNVELQTEKNTPLGQLVITNLSLRRIVLD